MKNETLSSFYLRQHYHYYYYNQPIRGAKPYVVRGGCHGGNVAVGHPIVPVDADKSAVFR